MQMSACTIAGLGVKARHAAYLMSQYWEVPMDRIDWDARAVRLLIEAVCDVARTPLPLRDVRENSLCSSAKHVCGHTLLDLPLNHPSMSRSVCAAGCDLLPELASFITSRL